jgi:hypothetical protein
MSAIPVSSDFATARQQIFAAFAAGETIVWSVRTRVTIQSSRGTPGQIAVSLVPAQSLGTPSGDYYIVPGVIGLACALPTDLVPQGDTVPANYGGFGLNAMDSDAFAYAYFMGNIGQGGNFSDISLYNT